MIRQEIAWSPEPKVRFRRQTVRTVSVHGRVLSQGTERDCRIIAAARWRATNPAGNRYRSHGTDTACRCPAELEAPR